MWTIKPEHLDMIEKAKRFMENYFRMFDEDRPGLMNLYREQSVLAWHDREIKGKEAIIAKLTSLPECHHEIAKFNCRPQCAPGSVAVRVCGETWIGGKNDKAEAVVSHQVFVLLPAPEGSFFVGLQSWSPRDLTKQQTPLALAPAPLMPLAMPWSMPNSASALPTPTLPVPWPMQAYYSAPAYYSPMQAYYSAPAYYSPGTQVASSEWALASSGSSESQAASSESAALALPMSLMKISALAGVASAAVESMMMKRP